MKETTNQFDFNNMSSCIDFISLKVNNCFLNSNQAFKKFVLCCQLHFKGGKSNNSNQVKTNFVLKLRLIEQVILSINV